jgi:hypothetical protein
MFPFKRGLEEAIEGDRSRTVSWCSASFPRLLFSLRLTCGARVGLVSIILEHPAVTWYKQGGYYVDS